MDKKKDKRMSVKRGRNKSGYDISANAVTGFSMKYSESNVSKLNSQQAKQASDASNPAAARAAMEVAASREKHPRNSYDRSESGRRNNNIDSMIGAINSSKLKNTGPKTTYRKSK